MSDAFIEMPILGLGRRELKGYPYKSVKIPLMCNTRALANHGQSLERLKERGGMGPDEICFVLDNKSLFQEKLTIEQTIERLKVLGVPTL